MRSTFTSIDGLSVELRTDLACLAPGLANLDIGLRARSVSADLNAADCRALASLLTTAADEIEVAQ